MKFVQVNLSSTFMAKSRCKHCSYVPQIYYYILNRSNIRFINIGNIPKIKCKRMCNDNYFLISPKDIRNISLISFPVAGNSSRIYKSRNIRSPSITEYLMCKCGRTSWAFNEKYMKKCLEFSNKRSRDNYPLKISNKYILYNNRIVF